MRNLQDRVTNLHLETMQAVLPARAEQTARQCKDRCPGLPIESPLAFYPRVIGGTIAKAFGYARTVWAFCKIMIEVRDAPDRTA